MKNLNCKKVYIFFSSLFILSLHLPFVFAKTAPVVNVTPTEMNMAAAEVNLENSYTAVYEQLDLQTMGLSEEAFNYAIKGYNYLKEKGRIVNEDILSIADFTKSSGKKRLFIIDLKNSKIVFNTYVAHGQGSGQEFANQFSNIPESLQSSLGFYVTSDTYIGKHGYSMHLNGVETGINDKANERAIVMHGADYVSEDFIKARGYIGRSWGCPAVPEKLTKPIIEKIKNGSCLFIFSGNKTYLKNSKILNS